jgi:hypothetical protein
MAGMADQAEQTLARGVFGTVTDKRVIYQRSKGWFSGGSREDIPLKHVTSVRIDISRSILGGALLLILGLSLILSPNGGVSLIGGALVLVGVLLLWGSPSVVVSTAGGNQPGSKGFPWHRSEADAFVDAIRHHMVNQ